MEKALLNEMTKNAYKDRRLWFGTETNPYDPRFQTEDLGDNSMKASAYGIKNLKRILPNLTEWSKENGEDYSELEGLYNSLMGQFRRYMGHVTKNVGGVYENPKTYDMAGNAYEVTPSAIQNEAVAFLNEQLFKTPTWLLNQNIISKIKGDVGVDAIKSMQDGTLSSLLSNDRLVRLIETSSLNKANYSVDELISDLKRGIFSELKSNAAIDIYRRNLQKVFVSRVIDVALADKTATGNFDGKRISVLDTDIPSIAKGQLVELKAQLKKASAVATDRLTKFHLNDLVARIENAMKPKQ